MLSSLGIALVYAGRTAAGLAAFDRAVQRSTGVLAARVLARRGVVLCTLGRYPAALEDLRHAVAVLRRAGDLLWTARALNNRGLVYLGLGSTSRADADFVSAARLFSEVGQELEAIYAVHNRALVAFASGDLPAALAFLDAATPGFRRLKVPTTALRIDRCAVLLAAGLAADALAEADASVREMEQIRGWSTKKAELLLMAANCALAAAQPQTRPGLGAGRVPPVPVAAQCLVAGSCGARARPGPLRGRPGVARAAPRGEPGGRPAGCPGRQRRGAGASAGRAESRWNSAAATTPNVIWQPWPGPDGAVRPCHGSAAGSARRCEPRPRTVRAGCWPPAAGGWTSWTSTGSPSAPRNSGRRPPCTAPSWPRSRSATPHGQAARGCC